MADTRAEREERALSVLELQPDLMVEAREIGGELFEYGLSTCLVREIMIEWVFLQDERANGTS